MSQASSAEIDILVVIDTEYIKKNFPKNTDPNKALGINHSSQYMICYSPRGIVSGQGTADLSFKALVGDRVYFRASSIQQNSEDAVILYGIKYWAGAKVFNTFVTDITTRNRAVQPNPDQPNGLPPVLTQQNFTSYNASIARGGTENFYVYIAVYTLTADGQGQELYGYYYWDPQVVVPV